MRRRVVITGMGAITPLGHSVDELYEHQLEGQSGVGPITLFDASTFPTQVRRRGQGLRPGPATSRTRALGRLRRQQPLRRRRRPAGPGRRRPARQRQGRPHALRRLPRLRRRHPGFPQPDLADRPELPAGQARRSTRPPSPRAGCSDFHAGREFEQELHTTPGHLADYFDLEGPELQLPDRLRRQQPGHRRGGRDDPPRRRRRDALRRLAQHDPPASA